MPAQKLWARQGDHLPTVSQAVLGRGGSWVSPITTICCCNRHWEIMVWRVPLPGQQLHWGVWRDSNWGPAENITRDRSAPTFSAAMAPQTHAARFCFLPACSNPLRNLPRICKVFWDGRSYYGSGVGIISGWRKQSRGTSHGETIVAYVNCI